MTIDKGGYGLVQWVNVKGKLTNEQIEDVERKIGFRFPLDFIEFVKEHNGGEPVQYKFDIGSKTRTLRDLLDVGFDECEVIDMYEVIRDDFEIEGLVPFATDISDNLYCFDYRQNENRPSIVFVDHEGGDPIYVCETFTDLINRLN